MKNLPIDKNGNRLYPIARWETHQHVFANYCDRTANQYYDTNSDEDYDKWQRAQELWSIFDAGVRRDGMVYVKYSVYLEMKNIIGGYAHRHGGSV